MTEEEEKAASAYRADARYFHATHQGWAEEFTSNPEYEAFVSVAAGYVTALDAAITRSPIPEELVVYSGHGNGGWTVGALRGDAKRFIGFHYMYPGYISTSRSMETALHSFLGKRAHPGSTPTLLELHLPKGFCALDMSFSSQGGEFEMLVGRRVEFEVTDAFNFDFKGSNDPVLRLVLVPAV